MKSYSMLQGKCEIWQLMTVSPVTEVKTVKFPDEFRRES